MEMLPGKNMKVTDILSTPEKLKWNTEPNPPVMPAVYDITRKIKILVVDDNDSIRCIISRHLNDIGFDVVEANNGFIGQYLFLNTTFSLVITDMEMPGMDGWTLAFSIKKEAPHTPIIMMTGSDIETIMENIKESCIDTVLFKPFRMEELDQNIKRMLGPVY